MSLRLLLDKAATIERSTPSRGNTGEVVPSWSVTASDVPCALRPISGATMRRDEADGLSARFRAYFPAGTDVRPRTSDGHQDRVTIDSVRYLVMFVQDEAGRGALIAADLTREA